MRKKLFVFLLIDSKKPVTVLAKRLSGSERSKILLSNLWHFNDRNSGLIYALSYIYWYILFLQFKTFKIQFHGVPHLHYVLVCKIHI